VLKEVMVFEASQRILSYFLQRFVVLCSPIVPK
jgi:hypothetical protein